MSGLMTDIQRRTGELFHWLVVLNRLVDTIETLRWVRLLSSVSSSITGMLLSYHLVRPIVFLYKTHTQV